jgi:glucose uptake protein GlcU
MKNQASRRPPLEVDAVGGRGLTTIPATVSATARLGQGSRLGLGIAQATLAAVLALAAAFLKPLGFAEGFIVGTAALVLVVSGVLLVVWSDRDDAVRPANWREETDYRSAA